MNEFFKRLLSGAVYVAILIIGILTHKTSYAVLIAIFSFLCLWEFLKLIKLKNSILFLILGIVLIAYYILKIPIIFTYTILAITIVTQLLLLYDLVSFRIIPMFEKKKYLTSVFYVITSFLFLSLIPFKQGAYKPIFVLGAFILIWVNDSFAYLVGKQIGKRKLYERISPNKTVEGFLGGLVFSIIASIVISQFYTILSVYQWIIFSIIVSVFGTIGDLIQSKFKRQAGVKDSGKIMPGHGGIFDRLDSVLYASPFVFLYLQIVNYVS